MADIIKAKKLLEEAMRCLPDGHACTNTKIHIKRAISELLHAQKTEVRHTRSSWPNWQFDPQMGDTVSPAVMEQRRKGASNALSLLDEMYAKEQEKLSELDKQTRHEEDNDGNDMEPLLG